MTKKDGRARSKATPKAGGKAKHAKLGHVPIRQVALDFLHPATLNDKIYRPVQADDPGVRALAEDIRQKGLLEPLVVARSYWLGGRGKRRVWHYVVISGHRRRVACQLAGLKTVPVRVYPIRSTDPSFPALLVSFNQQRVKQLDEVVREQVALADPEEAYRLLTEHREKKAWVQVETIELEGVKTRAQITAAKALFLSAIKAVLDDRRDFWPLTDRQIHYALLNDPPLIHASKPSSQYCNDLKSYKALCELLTRARLAGEVPMTAIEDGTRPVIDWSCYRDPGPFVRDQLDDFLKGYYRDLQQSQPNHVEIVGEKNTIANVIRPVAAEFCIPMTLGRGYSSLPPRNKMARRFRDGGKENLVILFLSDFDPEGEDIPHSFALSMRDDFGVKNVRPVKVALTAQQVARMQLHPQMQAKKQSSRYEKFSGRHGDDVFELEAIPPEALQQLLRDAIDGVLDVGAFNAEVDAEKRDATHLDQVRRQVHTLLGDLRLDGPNRPQARPAKPRGKGRGAK
jgi:hypothetical protein